MTVDQGQIIDDRALHVPHPGSSLMLFDRYHRSVSFEDLYLGQHLFLCLSGPSLPDNDLYALEQRGIVTMAVNNAWSILRPNLWCCVDSPSSFLDGGWLDPAIMKFCPIGVYGKKLRTRDPQTQKLVERKERPLDCPNTWFFRRNCFFDPKRFLTEPTVNWGGDDTYTDPLGIRGKRSVMLAAIRLAYYLGFRRVYLLGADFNMELGARNYAFPQERVASAVKHNNSQYVALNKRFAALDPYFRVHDFTVFNCLQGSGLVEVQHKPFKQAVDEALAAHDLSWDTMGWYDPPADPEDHIDYEALYELLYQEGYHSEQKEQSWALGYLWPWATTQLKFKTVLDIGASYGGLVQRATDDGYTAVGIEISDRAVAWARDNGRDVRKGNATGLPVPSREFDLVVSADTFEHVHPRDVEKAIDESIRVSKRFIAMKIATSEARIQKWNDRAGHNLHLSVFPHEFWLWSFFQRAVMRNRDPIVLHQHKEQGIFILELQK